MAGRAAVPEHPMPAPSYQDYPLPDHEASNGQMVHGLNIYMVHTESPDPA